MTKQVSIAPDKIIINENFGLRRVRPESEEFQGIVQSIQQKGFITTITVREYIKDGKPVEGQYELIDGLQRLTAAKQLGLKTVPAIVVDMDAAQVLQAQIMTNIHRVETRPVEYTQQLKRIMGMNPMMTVRELAVSLGKSELWVQNRLSIDKIKNADIQELINSGKIPLASAYALAKLPEEEQPNWVQRALTESQQQFSEAVTARVREINNERRKGRDAAPPTFQPVAHLRSVKEIKNELDVLAAFKELRPKTPEDAFRAAVQWVLNLDPPTVAKAEKKWHDDRAKLEAEKAARKEAREKEKAAKATQTAAAIK